jgi:hypothetical protein
VLGIRKLSGSPPPCTCAARVAELESEVHRLRSGLRMVAAVADEAAAERYDAEGLRRLDPPAAAS